MAYIKPAVQVYQDLVSPGGAQQLSPDMPACIVGTAKTVVDVDFDDDVSKTNSIGSLDNGDPNATPPVAPSQIDATFDEIPSTPTSVYINVTSRKPGQANVEVGNLFVENAVVENVTATAAVSGNELVLTVIQNGGTPKTTVNLNDPLPYFSSINHASIGDTVVEFTTGAVTATSYITAIDLDTNTITVNDASDFTTNPLISIYRKFSQLPLISVTGATGDVLMDASQFASPAVNSGADTRYPINCEKTVENLDTVPVVDRIGDPYSIYAEYSADRGDLVGTVLTINDINDLETQLGPITVDNELAFGISLALANSGGTAINAITLDPNLPLTAAHTSATELAQAQRLYAMVPLTQELSIQAVYKNHVNAMSLPESGNWRVAMVNCEVPDYIEIIGKAGTSDGTDADNVPDGLIRGVYTSGSLTFALDRPNVTTGIRAGDRMYMVQTTVDDETLELTHEYVWSEIASFTPNTIVVDGDWFDSNDVALDTDPVDNAVAGMYVARFATRQQQAQWVADQSATWLDKRVWNFPGDVYVLDDSGLESLVPGYFLQCALAGFISGTPAQQPITNIAIAGITDLAHGNFYFTEAQMNLMAQYGTLLYAQNNQGTTPFCRHGLTTDVSVLEYREVLKVKNWDYLSYYYKDILAPFIGVWNITPDTLQTIRQTVISASESLLTRKLPRIGAPLLSYNIDTLEIGRASCRERVYAPV